MILAGARAFGYLTDRWTSRIVADFIFQPMGLKPSPSGETFRFLFSFAIL